MSIDTVAELDAVLANLEVDVIELLFNIFAQSTRDRLEAIKEKGIALIIKVPLDSGWLTGKYDREATFTDIRTRWSQADLNRRHDLTKRLKTMVDDGYLTPYAMGFLWSYKAVTTVIPGIRTIAQLEEHVAITNLEFPSTQRKTFERFYDETIAHDPLPW